MPQKIIHSSHPDTMTIAQLREHRKKPKPSKELATMKQNLKHNGFEYEEEYKFMEGRRFKFDIALRKYMIAVEYEGLIFRSNKEGSTGKSGHTTVTGYSNNCQKYNLATILGWRVLRYTAMNYEQMMDDVRKLIKNDK